MTTEQFEKEFQKFLDNRNIHYLDQPFFTDGLYIGDSTILFKFIELKCKETARNVRHKSCELVVTNNVGYADNYLLDDIRRNIMNIQFKDIKPY